MNPSITNVFTMALIGLHLSCVALGASNRNEYGNSLQSSSASSVLKTCIDDSDCANIGPGGPFRCFVYICYPWKDDSAVPEKEKRNTCRKDSDCRDGQECYRHSDKRNVNTGLCFDEIQDCRKPKDCKPGFGCCSEYCCEDHYFQEYMKLPCPNHLMCQDFGLGDFCCPTDTNSTICCDTDPNPKPTQAPSVGDSASAITMTNVNMIFGFSVFFVISKLLQ